MKKLGIVLLMLCILCMLAGCGVELEFTVNQDGSYRMDKENVYYSEAEMSGLEEEASKYEKVAYRGNTYYLVPKKEEDKDAFEDINLVSNENGSYIGLADLSSMALFEFYDITIHYPREVLDTNGEIQKDGKSVYFNAKEIAGTSLWVTYKKNAFDTVAAKISGVKNGGKYKTGKKFILTTDGIFTAATLTVENEAGKRTRNVGCEVEVDQEGDYTYTYTVGKATKSVKFTIDTTKPETNIEGGGTYDSGTKITFSDNLSGIKTAKLDGKAIKSGTKVTAKGSHKLKLVDKCGNSKTVKFKIK